MLTFKMVTTDVDGLLMKDHIENDTNLATLSMTINQVGTYDSSWKKGVSDNE